jgi:hypothetical protein
MRNTYPLARQKIYNLVSRSTVIFMLLDQELCGSYCRYNVGGRVARVVLELWDASLLELN